MANRQSRVRRDSPNPLARWLAAHPTLTQQAFADRCSVIDGRRITQAQVSHWLGNRTPILATRRLIERATTGAVPVSAWADRRRPPMNETAGAAKPLHPHSGRVRKATDAGGAP
jgi:hypothetical protein